MKPLQEESLIEQTDKEFVNNNDTDNTSSLVGIVGEDELLGV